MEAKPTPAFEVPELELRIRKDGEVPVSGTPLLFRLGRCGQPDRLAKVTVQLRAL
jgi:hypothetical protein